MNEKVKKILSGVGVLAAFGLGGAAIAGAQNDKPADKPAISQPGTAESEAAESSEAKEANEGNEAKEANEGNEAEQKVTGADADRAGQAALQSVGGGKVLEVERETPDQEADRAEPGDKPDSASEQAMERNTAYSVEIQKSDGTTVDVALDGSFTVLGTEQDDEQGEQDGESASEQAEAPAQR